MALEDFKLRGQATLDDKPFLDSLGNLKEGSEQFATGFKNNMFASMTAANLLTKAIELVATSIRSAVSAHVTLEKQLAKVNTVLDKTVMDKAMLRNELFKVSEQTGVWAEELAGASYEALSAGIATKDLGEFVKQSAILSQAGFMTTTQAVNVLTSTIGAYGKEALTVEEISNKLVTAQANGKFTIEGLSNSMASVTPVAASLGVSFDEVLASLAAITMTGTSVSEATTRLRAALNSLSSSSSNVSQIFKEMTGQTFQEFISSGRTVGEAFEYISEYSTRTGESLTEIMGSSEGALAVLQTLSGAGENYRKTLEAVGEEQMKAKDTAAEATDHMGYSWSKLGNDIKIWFLDDGGVFQLLNKGLLWFANNTFTIVKNTLQALTLPLDMFNAAYERLTGKKVDTPSAPKMTEDDEMNSLATSQANAVKVSEAKKSAEQLGKIKELELNKDTKLKESLLQNEIDFQKNYNSLKEKGAMTEAELSKFKTEFEISQQKKSLESEKNILLEKQNYYKSKSGFDKELIETGNKLKEIELKEQQLHTSKILADERLKEEGLRALKSAEAEATKLANEEKRKQRELERAEREKERILLDDHYKKQALLTAENDMEETQRQTEFLEKKKIMQENFFLNGEALKLVEDEEHFRREAQRLTNQQIELENDLKFYGDKQKYAVEHAETMAAIAENRLKQEELQANRNVQVNEDLNRAKQNLANKGQQIAANALAKLVNLNNLSFKEMLRAAKDAVAQALGQEGSTLIVKGTSNIIKGSMLAATPGGQATGAAMIATGKVGVAKGTAMLAGGIAIGAIGGGSDSASESGGSSYESTENGNQQADILTNEKPNKELTIYTDGDMKDVFLSLLSTLDTAAKDGYNVNLIERG